MKHRAIWLIVISVALAVVLWVAFCGYQWSWGPFHRLHDLSTARLPGNAPGYAPENARRIEDSPLAGKTILFLGSSVTYGASAKGVSFADYIAVRNNCTSLKEAVSGTTLTDNGPDSYIARMKQVDKTIPADFFICQLSTNDASQNKPLGAVSAGTALSDFDTHTVAGAIEYVIVYARETWHCPVLFYTNPYYDSSAYEQMTDLLKQIAQKWDIEVIDLWSDELFNDISKEQRTLYMADQIHPTQAGYLQWWTPVFEKKLYELAVK